MIRYNIQFPNRKSFTDDFVPALVEIAKRKN
jgi:hypothetical protein